MAYYKIEPKTADHQFSLDPSIISLATQESSIHNFADELRIISEHTELVKAQEKADKEKADKEKAIQDKIDADNKAKEEAEAQAKAAQEEADKAAAIAEAEAMATVEGMSTSEQTTTPTTETTAATAATTAIPGKPSKPDASTKPTIAKNLNGNNGNNTTAAIPTVAGIPTTMTDTPVVEAVSVSPVATADSSNIPPPILTRELSAGAQDAIRAVERSLNGGGAQMPAPTPTPTPAVDPVMENLLYVDSLITKMCERTKCSREDGQFYLDSADHNLDAAIELYESLVMN